MKNVIVVGEGRAVGGERGKPQTTKLIRCIESFDSQLIRCIESIWPLDATYEKNPHNGVSVHSPLQAPARPVQGIQEGDLRRADTQDDIHIVTGTKYDRTAKCRRHFWALWQSHCRIELRSCYNTRSIACDAARVVEKLKTQPELSQEAVAAIEAARKRIRAGKYVSEEEGRKRSKSV